MKYTIAKKLRSSTYVALKVEGMEDDASIQDYYNEHGTFKYITGIGYKGNQEIIDALRVANGMDESCANKYADDLNDLMKEAFENVWNSGFEAGEEAGIDYAMEGSETRFRILPNTKFELWHIYTDKQQVVSYQEMLDCEVDGFANRRPDGTVIYSSEGRPQIEMLANNLMKMAQEFKDKVDNMEWY